MAGFLESLIGTESGGNWQARNNVTGAGGMAGHFGRLQFGKARLQDAMRAGVIPQGMTPEQFMADPTSQQKVEAWHFSDIDSQAQRMGLDRYIGQNVNGIPVTQDAIRAMAHLGGIGGAAKFLNTGGKYNPSDAYGTSLADYATKHGGDGGMAQVQGGGGLLTAAGGGAQDQLAPEPKKGLLGFLSNPDARARLAIALEGMTLNPNEAFMQSMQQGIQTRGETKAATEAKNKTAAWLRSQGREDLAAAVEGGIVSGSDAFAAMRPGEPVKGVEVGNNLVNPITGELIYSGQAEAKPGFRIATPDEAKAYGAAAGQFGPDGRFYAADSGGMVVYGPDGQPIMTTGGAVPKPFTEAQSKDVVFATRAKGALDALDPVAGELTNRMSRAAEYDPTGLARGMVQSDKFQLAKNAGDEFLQALLRKDSGAAITEGEQALYGVTYLPQPGDSAALIEQKTAARQRAVAAIEAGMSPAQIIAQEQAVASGGKAPTSPGPAKISSDAEYDALPSGSEFVGPDGIKRRKP